MKPREFSHCHYALQFIESRVMQKDVSFKLYKEKVSGGWRCCHE